MLRSLRVFAEFVAGFLGLVLLLAILAIWRLSASPVNSAFLTPYVEAGIERFIPGAHPQIAHTLLTWDNADRSIALHADGLTVKNGKGIAIITVPDLDMRVSLIGLLVGQFWPTELTVDHPQFKLERHRDGHLTFAGLETGAAAPEAGDEDDTRETFKNVMASLVRAYAMRHLVVDRAVVDVHDEASNTGWSVSIPEISVRHTFTQLAGDAKLDLTQKDQVASLELHYAYDYVRSLHRFSTRFSDITPSQLVGGHPETLGLDAASMFDLPLSGETEVAFDPELEIVAIAVNLHGGKGSLCAPTIWDKPRAIASVDIEGDIDRKAHKLNLTTASFDFGGPKLSMTATGKPPADAQHYDLDFTMTARFSDWPMNAFNDLWPKPLISDAREWIVHNLTNGSYDKGEGKFNGSLSWNDLANMSVTSGQGRISASNATVSYIEGMPPVQGVSTEAEFDLDKMTLNILGGGIGDLRLQPFTITISGLSDPDQFIDIPLHVAGPIPDVVKLIDYPPLRYAQVVGLTPDSLTGMADGTVNLHFELLKSISTKDIDITASAALSNVATSRLVKGVDIAQGDLNLDLDKDGLTVKGAALIDKLPFQLALQQAFHAIPGKPLRQIDLSGTLKDEQWKTLATDVFTDTRGSATLAVHVSEPDKNHMQFSGSLDMTNADLHFAPLNWKKAAGVPATLQFDAEGAEGKDINVKSITLRSPQAHADGKAIVGAGGAVRSASFAPLVVGRTSANISFSQAEGEAGALRFEAKGKSLDVSGMRGGKDPDRADPRPKEYHINVDKLYTGDTGVIVQANGFAIRDGEGWNAISLHGLADGEHKLDFDLTPNPDGTRGLSITCDDFGKMLKGLGFTDTVKEGDVKIVGGSKPESPRTVEGTVKIGSFSVGNLPVLMQLLNATSPFGFADLVTNRSSFDHLKGNFRWTGDEIDLQHVNAAGSSVGMNINGKVDMNTGRANLSGTLVPFSMVNRIIGSIPLIGDLLTGGEGGGVLAVAYTIKGTLADPKIGVNPVSLLTPGFLRNLFFGGGEEPSSE